MSTGFDYDNRTGRPPGRVLAALGVVLPGVRRVQAQAAPYAEAWRAGNLELLGRPPRGRRWVVLGDSMSQGVGASAHDRGWVGQLAERIGGLEVLNLSATGARTRDLLDVQLPLLEQLTGDAPADLVTVLIGSNDLFAGGAVRAQLPDAFAELVERLPDGAVVASLPQPREAARLADAHLERAAAQGRLRMVDLRVDGPSSWRGRLASDLFHPNDAGYAALADAFEPVARAALTAGRRD